MKILQKIILEYPIVFQIILMSGCVLFIHKDFYNAADLETKITRIFQMFMLLYFAIIFLAVHLALLARQLSKLIPQKQQKKE